MSRIKLCAVALVLVLVCGLCGCAGLGDWENTELPGAYEIWRVNGDTIALVERMSETFGQYVVESYVFRMAYNDDYIFVQQAESREAVKSGEALYYIVDVASGEVLGGFAQAEFEGHEIVQGLATFPEWTDATKKP